MNSYRNKKILAPIFLFALAILPSCTEKTPEEKPVTFTDKQIGQMVVVGFRGTEINSESPVVKDIKQRNIGGVILYDYDYTTGEPGKNIDNPDQLLKLNSALVGYSSTPPIISVEHDGSNRSALSNMYPEMENIFSGSSLSDSAKVKDYAMMYAQEFMVVGINTNFHPRLDLKTPQDNNKAAQNIISSDAEEVTAIASLILKEYDTEKLLSVPKYFPGYSAGYLPTDTSDTIDGAWDEENLTPYKQLFDKRTIRAVQTSHSLNTNIDADWPGTFSAKTIHGLLRDSLGFEGVVFSDDLQKPIITSRYGLETAIKRSVNAGVDILVFGNNFEYDEEIAQKVIGIIQKLLAEGEIHPETIQATLARINKLKQDVIAELCTCLTT